MSTVILSQFFSQSKQQYKTYGYEVTAKQS